MPKKIELYTTERQDVINKLFDILEITNSNKIFSLHRLDKDIETQEKIISLEPEIKKYFKCGRWTCFNHKDNVNRKWLSIIKYLLKDMNISYSTLNKTGIGAVYCII